MTESTENVYYAPEMRYPLRGGFRAFIDPLVAHADVRLNHRVSRVEPIVKQLHFSNGNIVRYNRLISTIPLPALVELIDDAPPEILRASRALVATSIDLISIGIRKPNTFSDVWFYIYDDDVAAARANCPSVQSPDNCPPGCSSIQFEIYSSARRPNPLDIQRMRENCISALQKWGFACPDDIAVTHHHHVRYGNVVFEQGMEKNRDIVRKWLLESGITGAGRFGEWDYLWSHQAFMSGAAAAHRLL